MPYNQTTDEPNLLIVVSYCIHILREVCRSFSFWATCIVEWCLFLNLDVSNMLRSGRGHIFSNMPNCEWPKQTHWDWLVMRMSGGTFRLTMELGGGGTHCVWTMLCPPKALCSPNVPPPMVMRNRNYEYGTYNQYRKILQLSRHEVGHCLLEPCIWT